MLPLKTQQRGEDMEGAGEGREGGGWRNEAVVRPAGNVNGWNGEEE